MNPSLRNLFRKKLTRERVVPDPGPFPRLARMS